MILKYISWLLVLGSIVGTIVYFNVYDRITRAPLRVLWVDSPYARDLRNILDEFTDRTNISVKVDSVPRELYRDAIMRDLDTLEQQYDVVIGEATWEYRDVERKYYEDITDLVRQSWLFKTYSPAIDGTLFVTKSGAYYGMPVALDVFGVAFAEGSQVPETWQDLVDVNTHIEGELTHAFLALLVAQGGVFIDQYGKLNHSALIGPTAQEVLEVMKTMQRGEMLPVVGRTEYLRRTATGTALFASLPGEGTSAYAITYLAHHVKGSQNPRAAQALIAWLGTKQASDFMQDENGTSLVASVHDKLRVPSYSETRRAGAVPVQFFINENAIEMLKIADTYLASYIEGTTNFTAQETLETIATAWKRELTTK